MELFVFNPEHDYALADGNAHYMPPRSAAQFSYDCAPMLSRLSQSGILHNLYSLKNGELSGNFSLEFEPDEITKVIPWGWDHAVRRHLVEAGVSENIMPSLQEIDKIRKLSHRMLTIKALGFLKRNSRFSHLFPEPAEILHSAEDVVRFVNGNAHSLLKSPFSGNGRGHLYAHGFCTPTLLRQATGVIAKQGSILAEAHHNVLQDFAMEFDIDGENVTFVGYSLFKTRKYAYDYNILCADEQIYDILTKFLSAEVVDEVRRLVAFFLQTEIAPFYQGNIGIDMFVYDENGYKLQPFSEANVRRTMGAVAHEIFNKFCDETSTGVFRIVRFNKRGELKHFVEEESRLKPLSLNNGKWGSGFVSLTPVNDQTLYAACVELCRNRL